MPFKNKVCIVFGSMRYEKEYGITPESFIFLPHSRFLFPHLATPQSPWFLLSLHFLILLSLFFCLTLPFSPFLFFHGLPYLLCFSPLLPGPFSPPVHSLSKQVASRSTLEIS